MNITITIGSLRMQAELNDTPTAVLTARALPLTSPFATWGDEIYFSIPVDSPLDDSAKEVVEMGDLGYWPSGKAFCIFFGPTPMSGHPGEIVPASAVNIIGKVHGDPTLFKGVMTEREIRIEVA
ncbi:MAG: cyclophilin-like fold protein [Pseudomonadota bacterium]